ncbi:MAG: hypothetical protein ACJ71O_09965 [Nitrososphaeraceae archaeon]
MTKYKDVIPFTEEIVSLGIDLHQLIAVDVGIKEAESCITCLFTIPPCG